MMPLPPEPQGPPPPVPQVSGTVDELYTVIGELEFIRRKLNQQIQQFIMQFDEMSKEITKLREALHKAQQDLLDVDLKAQNGRLVQTDNNE